MIQNSHRLGVLLIQASLIPLVACARPAPPGTANSSSSVEAPSPPRTEPAGPASAGPASATTPASSDSGRSSATAPVGPGGVLAFGHGDLLVRGEISREQTQFTANDD